MPTHLLVFLLEISTRTHDTRWLRSEIHRRIAQLRSDSVVLSQHIPSYFDESTLSELDDIITATWLITAGMPVDRLCLLELDVLSAALKLPGGQTRLALHMRDTIKDMGLANPWELEST